MVASRETLQDFAAERQLQPAALERVILLIDILDAFGTDALIGPRIALKCGTAAWIESVTAECRENLVRLFQFTAGERAFLDGVLDRGEIDASPMGVPESVRAAIEACPALRWKAQNVKAWKSGDKSLVPRVRRGRRPHGEPTP
jgi:hypothetical protein